jgi:hypothetical protein
MSRSLRSNPSNRTRAGKHVMPRARKFVPRNAFGAGRKDGVADRLSVNDLAIDKHAPAILAVHSLRIKHSQNAIPRYLRPAGRRLCGGEIRHGATSLSLSLDP